MMIDVTTSDFVSPISYCKSIIEEYKNKKGV